MVVKFGAKMTQIWQTPEGRQTARQTDMTSLSGQIDEHANRLFLKVDQQVYTQTAGQTELRNYYIGR